MLSGSTKAKRAPTKLLCLFVALAIAQGCGSDSPTGPSPAPAPNPSPPAQVWTVRGRVVAYGSGRRVAGAKVSPEVGDSVVTGSDGAFEIGSDTNPEFTPYRVTVTAEGHVERKARLNWQAGLRSNVTIDVIALAAPFSLAFYRQLVRNAHDNPGSLEGLRRWTANPNVYIQTVNERGEPIDGATLDTLAQTIRQAVVEFSAGRLAVGRIERGPEARAERPGWIRVLIRRELEGNVCGTAHVGADPGLITLVYNRCSCGPVARMNVNTIRHEVGHAMGFWHVADRESIMHNTWVQGCGYQPLSPLERYHVALAYTRPPGSVDPDTDPPHLGFATAPGIGSAVEVRCGRS